MLWVFHDLENRILYVKQKVIVHKSEVDHDYDLIFSGICPVLSRPLERKLSVKIKDHQCLKNFKLRSPA